MRTLVLVASALLVGGTVEAQATAQGRSRTVERDARRAEEAATGPRDRRAADCSDTFSRAPLHDLKTAANCVLTTKNDSAAERRPFPCR